jgi:hypothetical protein
LSITSCTYLIVSSWFFWAWMRFLKDITSCVRRSNFSFKASCLSNLATNSLFSSLCVDIKDLMVFSKSLELLLAPVYLLGPYGGLPYELL